MTYFNVMDWTCTEGHQLSPDCLMKIQALRSEVEALRGDAERYRWLRDNDRLCEYADYSPDRLDAAIDAARSESALDRMAQDAREKGLDDWTEGEK